MKNCLNINLKYCLRAKDATRVRHTFHVVFLLSGGFYIQRMGELAKIEIKSKHLRKSVNYTKTNCYICNKHKGITEWHHLKRLKDCAKEFNNGINIIENKLVCLCPNCHSYFHKLLYSDFTENEQYRLLSMWGETEEMREKIINIKPILWI